MPENRKIMNSPLLAKIRFPLPLPECFDYSVPDGMPVQDGSWVRVPLGHREAVGVVWELAEVPREPKRELKPVSRLYSAPPLRQDHRQFLEFVARYSCFGLGRILRMSMPGIDGLEDAPQEALIGKGDIDGLRMTASRQKVLDIVGDGEWRIGELAGQAGVSQGVVTGLIKSGALTRRLQSVDHPFPEPDPDIPGKDLTEQQQQAADSLIRTVQAGRFAPVLLDGVTGSGKTEVYFEAVAEALRTDPDAQVLILLPEIALTQDVMQRFAKRFGAAPAEWHSDCTASAKRRVWRRVAQGQARIVVGARSALFLPFANLRLIVVDEEHDSSYKQEDGVLYHARNMAVVRASTAKCPIVLASATPSLESQQNARAGKYGHLELPSRPGAAVMPDIDVIDLKSHPPMPGNWISEPLAEAMQATLARKEQVLLYLNRRGYAPITICQKCGARMKAPHTDSYLVEHRFSGRLVCHLTGYSRPKPDKCPECGEKDSLHPVGPGVERLADEAARRFPDAKTEVFSSDTARNPAEVRALIARMVAGEIDILIGTQIAAKGHNFNNLTLVGVVDADMGFSGADLRAGERTWQTLQQVAGRAGRATKPGRALLQTHDPDNAALQALMANDRERFVEAELGLREAMGFPPFGRLASVVLSSRSGERVEQAAREFAGLAPHVEGVDIWGPSEPVFAMVRGRHRRRLLVRSGLGFDLPAYMSSWRKRFKAKGDLRISVDTDPYSFF